MWPPNVASAGASRHPQATVRPPATGSPRRRGAPWLPVPAVPELVGCRVRVEDVLLPVGEHHRRGRHRRGTEVRVLPEHAGEAVVDVEVPARTGPESVTQGLARRVPVPDHRLAVQHARRDVGTDVVARRTSRRVVPRAVECLEGPELPGPPGVTQLRDRAELLVEDLGRAAVAERLCERTDVVVDLAVGADL